MPAMSPFDPKVDRASLHSVSRFFSLLWPNSTNATAVARFLAGTVETAHAAGEECWSLSMHAHYLRVNVGQVETLTLIEDGARVLVTLPVMKYEGDGFEIDSSKSPVYRSVPVPSAVCDASIHGLSQLPVDIVQAHFNYIRSAASLKRRSPFKGSHSPAVLEYLEGVLGVSLPRPAYSISDDENDSVNLLPGDLGYTPTVMEGGRLQVTVNRYERDRRARQLCIAIHGTTCVLCKMSFGEKYGSLAEGFIHVHHLQPLAEIGEEHQVDPVEDLRPVCPNCHAVLHMREPAYSIEEVMTFLQQADVKPVQ
jgi:5-methylcytosine-specific restriction enzyme A